MLPKLASQSIYTCFIFQLQVKTEPRPVPSVKTPSDVAFDTADSEGLFELDGMDENPPTTFHSEDETDTEGMFELMCFGH